MTLTVEYAADVCHFRITVLEDPKGSVSSFFRTMLVSKRDQDAQQFKSTVTYFDAKDRAVSSQFVVEDCWLSKYQLLGLAYSSTTASPVINEVVISFKIENLTSEA